MIDNVLSRLDKVRANGRNKWTARCPAHQDRGPSLSIAHAADGKILLYCFAGCTADEITGAIGLELKELFPDNGDLDGRIDEWKRRKLEQEARELLLFVKMVEAAKERGDAIIESDQAEYRKACRRLTEIRGLLR